VTGYGEPKPLSKYLLRLCWFVSRKANFTSK
jgi:hypothetical protein